MADKTKKRPSVDKQASYPVGADQADGERNEESSTKVGRTPGQAEGSRETVDESLRNQEKKKK